MKRAKTTLGLAAALLAPVGCTMSIEGELPDVEVTQRDVRIPGLPDEVLTAAGEGGLTVPVAQSHDKLGLPGDGYSEVKVREVTLTAKSGVTDLGFIRSLRITVSPVQAFSAGTPGAEIARYERADGAAIGPVLRIPADPPVDVADAWRADVAVVVFEVVGKLPQAAWTLDLGVRYGAKLGLK